MLKTWTKEVLCLHISNVNLHDLFACILQNDQKGVKSSKNKTPWMSYNDVDVADSQFCIEYLNKELGIDLSRQLSPQDKAIARAFQKMVEENLYW